MKGLFQNGNRIYCLTNIFAVMICTTNLLTFDYQDKNLSNIVSTELNKTNVVETESEEASPIKVGTNKKKANIKAVVVTKSEKKTKKTTKSGDVGKYYGSVTGDAIVAYARSWKNHKVKYKYAGRSFASGTDCSGFTNLVYKHFGINRLGVTVEGQLKAGKRVARKDLQKGDIIIYTRNGQISHAAIYAGNGKIVHMSAPGTDVVEWKIDIPGSTYYAAVRVLNYYSVKFKDSDGKDLYDEKGEKISSYGKVGEQSIIQAPNNPYKEGYKFIGWYKGETLFDFSKKHITKNTTLTAKFEKIETPISTEVIKEPVKEIEKTEEVNKPVDKKTETGSVYNN